MANVAFVGAGASGSIASGTYAAAITLYPALPAGYVAGDMLVLVVGAYDTSASPAVGAPSGWSAQPTYGNATAQTGVTLFTRVAVGGEAAPALGLAPTGYGELQAQILAFRNADPTTPILAVTAGSGGTATSIPAPAPALRSGCALLSVVIYDSSTSAPTSRPASSATVSASHVGSRSTFAAAYGLNVSAATPAGESWSASVPSAYSIQDLALQPTPTVGAGATAITLTTGGTSQSSAASTGAADASIAASGASRSAASVNAAADLALLAQAVTSAAAKASGTASLGLGIAGAGGDRRAATGAAPVGFSVAANIIDKRSGTGAAVIALTPAALAVAYGRGLGRARIVLDAEAESYAPAFRVADYANALAQLMPRGRAWLLDPDGPQGQLLQALAHSFERSDAAARELLTGAFPATATSLLGEWEASVGLPRPDADVGSKAHRRVLLLLTLAGPQGPSRTAYQAVASLLGVPLQIVSYAPLRAGVDCAGEAAAGADWAHAIGFSIGSAPEWAQAVLAARLRAMTPGHVAPLITFAPATPDELPAGLLGFLDFGDPDQSGLIGH